MVISSIIALTGLGFAASILLAAASKIFFVEEDPRIVKVLGALPGANCGGCGYAGCEGYATAVATDPKIPPNLCVAGGAKVSVAVGELTGKTAAESEPLCTHRRCEKVAGQVSIRYQYEGMPSCAAAASLAHGADECRYSCLGYGDCVETCPFQALRLENHMVFVNEHLCTGCGKCTHVCPREVLQLIPKRARVVISCSSRDKLKAVMDVCKIGCIHCGKCIRNCPANAISMIDDRIQIDHKKCLSYGPDCDQKCASSCPRHILTVICPNALELGNEQRSA